MESKTNHSAPAGRRVFGWVEVVFDGLYLLTALWIGVSLLAQAGGPARRLAGVMALVLAVGDAFHLAPRILSVVSKSPVGKGPNEPAPGRPRLDKALGLGKLVASLTMTVFYVLLWHIGVMLFAPAGQALWTGVAYALALARIGLCLLPQNRWFAQNPPTNWALYRNTPFTLLGVQVAALFGLGAGRAPGLGGMGIAIALSFAFYLPVALFVGKNRKLGMLMLPKTCMYVWILLMCASALP